MTNCGVRVRIQRGCSEMAAENIRKLERTELTAPPQLETEATPGEAEHPTTALWNEMHVLEPPLRSLNHALGEIAWIKMCFFLWIFQVVMANENKHHVARVDPAPALVQPLPRGLQCGRSEIRTFCMEVVILVSHCWQLPLGHTPWIALTHILSLLQPQELCSGWKPEHWSFYLWK